MTHIALFEDLRRKVRALAPVSSIAKSVSDEIEPLAEGQKPFETPLIQRLRKASIITELEAQRLQQLNDQRNKAAHPSGHEVTAEEARFVFSEAIKKFLSRPIRQTSYVVDLVISKLAQQNFFPSATISEMTAIVDQEIGSLDKLGMPFLISKLASVWGGTDSAATKNARFFLIVLAAKRDADTRSLLIKHVVVPYASLPTSAQLTSELASVDPHVLIEVDPATKLRVASLLLSNAKTVGIQEAYLHYRSPVRVLAEAVRVIGEMEVLTNFSQFSNWVIESVPTVAPFISAIATGPKIFERWFGHLLKHAGSADFGTANAFANIVAGIDVPLAAAINDRQAFELVVAIARAADIGAFSSQALANDGFTSIPKIRIKAKALVETNSTAAEETLLKHGLGMSSADFAELYLPATDGQSPPVPDVAPDSTPTS